jgi:L-ascorbate metabolism protein UlaG (beta-lactamase superfamily)
MKLTYVFTLLLVLVGLQGQAQQAAPDQLETKKGALTIQPVQHAATVLKWDNKTIYVDPAGGANLFAGMAAPDLILITDTHGDHMDLKTLEAINTAKATLVVPQAVADKLPAALKPKVVVLANGAKTTKLGVSITAIPMYNLPETADSRHPKGRGNGYVINVGDRNIYFSGDTEDIAEMRALKNIDVAFVCMNLPYTMDVNQAAQAVLAFKPKIVYPYHYRGTDGLADVNAFKSQVNGGNNKIEVRLRNWYPGT